MSNVTEYQKLCQTRQPSCVNARGTTPAAQQVFVRSAVLSWPGEHPILSWLVGGGGGTPYCPGWGYPMLTWPWGYTILSWAEGYPILLPKFWQICSWFSLSIHLSVNQGSGAYLGPRSYYIFNFKICIFLLSWTLFVEISKQFYMKILILRHFLCSNVCRNTLF